MTRRISDTSLFRQSVVMNKVIMNSTITPSQELCRRRRRHNERRALEELQQHPPLGGLTSIQRRRRRRRRRSSSSSSSSTRFVVGMAILVVGIVSLSQEQQNTGRWRIDKTVVRNTVPIVVVTALLPNYSYPGRTRNSIYRQMHCTVVKFATTTINRHRPGVSSRTHHHYRHHRRPPSLLLLAKKTNENTEEDDDEKGVSSKPSSSYSLSSFWGSRGSDTGVGPKDKIATKKKQSKGDSSTRKKKKEEEFGNDDDDDGKSKGKTKERLIPFIGRLFSTNPDSGRKKKKRDNDRYGRANMNGEDDDDDDDSDINNNLLSASSSRVAKMLEARRRDRDAEELREEVLRREEEKKRQLEDQRRSVEEAKERYRAAVVASKGKSATTSSSSSSQVQSPTDNDRKIQAQREVDQSRIDRLAQRKKEQEQRELPLRLQNDLDRTKRIESRQAKAALAATATMKNAVSSNKGGNMGSINSTATTRPSKGSSSSSSGDGGQVVKKKPADGARAPGDTDSDDDGANLNVMSVAQRFVANMVDSILSPKQKEEWIIVAPKTKISPGEIVPVTIAGLDLLLVASKDGSSLYCIANSCPHLGTPLELATLERRPIEIRTMTTSSSSSTGGETQSSSSSSSSSSTPADSNNPTSTTTTTFPSKLFLETDIARMLKQDGCEDCIVCPLHRTAFALESGEVRGEWCPYPPVIGKLTGAVKKESSLAVFDVRTKGKFIEVRLNTPLASSSSALSPDD